MKALITRKVGMASIITDDGTMQAVTLLSASPNVISQIKTIEKDGYQAVQLGFEENKHPGKAAKGHFKNIEVAPKVVREFRVEGDLELKTGDKITVENFATGDIIDATGTTKGKGFAGGIKRHNFARGRKTHGGRSYRRPGSIGSMYPQKIFKGKRMAGQYGSTQVTVKNLKVSIIDSENNLIGVLGAVPGPKKSIIMIREAK